MLTENSRIVGKELIPIELIEGRILLLRGQKILLDKDLAQLYGVETFNLNKAVRRNLDRFLADFMFQLMRGEFKNLIFHFGISRWGGMRKGVIISYSNCQSDAPVSKNHMRGSIIPNQDVHDRTL